MSLPPELRRNIVLQQEGAVLASVGHHGPEAAAGMAYAIMDGVANGIARLDGYHAAATFAYAVGDRMVAGIKEPADFRRPTVNPPPPPAPEPEPVVLPSPPAEVITMITAVPAEQPPAEPPPIYRSTAYWFGVLHGMLILAAVTFMGLHS